MTLTHTKLSNIVHTLYGFIGVLLGYEWLFTAVFMVYQVVDLLCEKSCEESCEEFKRDLIEYTLGLVAGILVKLLLASAGLLKL